jgi:hypothetical protein
VRHVLSAGQVHIPIGGVSGTWLECGICPLWKKCNCIRTGHAHGARHAYYNVENIPTVGNMPTAVLYSLCRTHSMREKCLQRWICPQWEYAHCWPHAQRWGHATTVCGTAHCWRHAHCVRHTQCGGGGVGHVRSTVNVLSTRVR